MLKPSSGEQKMSLTEKQINWDTAVVDGTPTGDHSPWISMQNLKLNNGQCNHKKDQMDDIGVNQNLKPKARANNDDVFLYLRISQEKFWEQNYWFIRTEMLKQISC